MGQITKAGPPTETRLKERVGRAENAYSIATSTTQMEEAGDQIEDGHRSRSSNQFQRIYLGVRGCQTRKFRCEEEEKFTLRRFRGLDYTCAGDDKR